MITTSHRVLTFVVNLRFQRGREEFGPTNYNIVSLRSPAISGERFGFGNGLSSAFR